MGFPKEKYERLYRERDLKILQLHKNGLNTIRIGEELGLNDNIVGRVLKRNGIKPAGRALNDEQKQQILNLFEEGYNTVQIANQMGIHDGTVGRNLVKMGLKARNDRRIFNDDTEKEIVKAYLEGRTTADVGSEYGVDANTVANIVRRHGEQLRAGGIPAAIKVPNFFKTIDSEEKAYYLGFMITDGSIVVHSNKTSIGIMIQEKDKYILDYFALLLGFEYEKVKVSNRKEAYIRFHCSEMVEDLEKYGVVPNKTNITYIPQIREDLVPHLFRGLFDGDGSIFVTMVRGKPVLRAAFYGTHLACAQFQQRLIESIGISKTKVYDKPGVSFISISRKKDLFNLYNYLYKDANIYLTRKKQKFEDNMHLLQYVNTEVTDSPVSTVTHRG
ncbi:hypothetical protein ACFX4N_24040 [Priestia sp. YIM B13551]|uniref:hypothetical protein n=1 Tax=Priestia sp. YIM B13551 TaxID=3366306 RepID=UPI00366E7636